MKRKLPALLLAGLLCLSLMVPALAVEEVNTLRIDDVTAYSPEAGVYTVREDGRFGYYRADGTLLLEPNYAYAGEFSDGMAPVSLTGEWSRAPEIGRTVERFQGGRFGYVDSGGVLMIPMQFAKAFPFSEGRAFAVRFDGQLVLLDKTGEELAVFPDAVLPENETIRFSEGLAVIPVKGREALEEQTMQAEQAELPEPPETVYLVVDPQGREVCTLTDPYVDYLGGFHSGRIVVAWESEQPLNAAGEPDSSASAPDRWGYRDSRGALAFEGTFESASAFSGGMAAVCVKNEDGENRYSFISPAGEMLVPAEYSGAVAYDGGLGALLLDGKRGYVDQTGRNLTGFKFDQVRAFHEGTAFVRVGSELQAIHENGKVLFSTGAVQALDFSGGVAVLRQGDGTCGVCDLNGNLLVPFEYENAFHWDGYLWLKRGDIWRVYNTAEVIDAWDASPVGEPASVGSFSDVPAGAWYADAVTWATDHDVITGTGGGLFSPDKPCTIGEILTFLWRAIGRPEPEIENPFSDVSASNYYYQAALWAYENGLVEGGTFGAAELCSRAAAVTYLWQLAGRPMSGPILFADISEDAVYAPAVAWAVEAGITDGSGDGLFSPGATCSRGQIVTFLYRFLKK